MDNYSISAADYHKQYCTITFIIRYNSFCKGIGFSQSLCYQSPETGKFRKHACTSIQKKVLFLGGFNFNFHLLFVHMLVYYVEFTCMSILCTVSSVHMLVYWIHVHVYYVQYSILCTCMSTVYSTCMRTVYISCMCTAYSTCMCSV